MYVPPGTKPDPLFEEIVKIGDTLKGVTDKTEARVDKLDQKANDLAVSLAEFKASGGRLGGGSFLEQKSFRSVIGDWVKTQHEKLKILSPGQQYGYEYKAAGTMLTTSNISGSGNVFQSNINQTPPRPIWPFHFRDLLYVVPTATGAVNYPMETFPTGEGSFAKNTEGAVKNLIDYDITMVALNLKYIAGRSKVSREMLQDLPFLQDYLSKSLTEDFLETEDAYYYGGIAGLAQAGVTSETLSAAKILDYIAQIENLGHRVTAMVTSPAGWSTILKTKPNDFSVPGGVSFDSSGNVIIAGVPLYKSPIVGAGKILLGDFGRGAAIAQAEGFNIRTTEYNSDDFDRNLVSFRAEARCDLMLFSPRSFVIGNY